MPREVTNQSAALVDINLFSSDAALVEAVKRGAGHQATATLTSFGAACGSAEASEEGRLANEHPPMLRTHDGKGRRIDLVDYHPAYHACMQRSMQAGLHGLLWESDPAAPLDGRNVVRAALLYVAAQMETGHCCPLTMTSAAVPALLHAPELAAQYTPKIARRVYDRRLVPMADKTSITIGMGLTEVQGGTDVRANTTTAVKAGGDAGPGDYRLSGHKWFLSAPMSDAFLVTARAEKGLSCFLVPRLRDDGTLNGLRLQRLKDKLGNRSNASSEVEFEDCGGWLVGEEGRGLPAIMEMVAATRLDCAVASAGLMRRAVIEAIHHCRQRRTFGAVLSDQPLMRHVLADLCLEVEAATALAMKLAAACDRTDDPQAAAWRRLMTPVVKYWVCKVAGGVIGEAMECLGGNGYVEESLLPRLYREAPVNAIWEGSGNVMALDVLRVLQREPEAARAVVDELEAAAGDDRLLNAGVGRIRTILAEARLLDVQARTLVECLAVTAAGCILRANAPEEIADGFVSSRLGSVPRQTYGQGLERIDAGRVLLRSLPPS